MDRNLGRINYKGGVDGWTGLKRHGEHINGVVSSGGLRVM